MGNCKSLLKILVLTVSALACLNCSNPVSKKRAQNQGLYYSLSRAEREGCVKIRIEAYTDVRRYVMPPVYYDNPMHKVSGVLFSSLRVTDTSGKALPYSVELLNFGSETTGLIEISGLDDGPCVIEYIIDTEKISAGDTIPSTSPVYINGSAGYLSGAYVFAVPYEGSVVETWRKKREIRLELGSGFGSGVSGVPAKSVYKNSYQLLFTQIVLGSEPAGAGHSSSQDFELRITQGNKVPSDRITKIKSSFTEILDTVTGTYGPLSEDSYPVFFSDITGGIEGVSSFTMGLPQNIAYGGIAVILAHEAIHNYVGIKCGDFDDPWWKEGATNYLGAVTAARSGMAGLFEMRAFLWGSSGEIPEDTLILKDYALSSPVIRDSLYCRGVWEDGFTALVYGKGSRVTMLLDRMVREATDNSLNIHDVTASLTQKYKNYAFTREDLITHFEQSAGVDIRPLFQRHVDSASVIHPDTLNNCFFDLFEMNAFGEHDTLTEPRPKKGLVKKVYQSY